MFSEYPLITVAFRIINFVGLFGLGYFLYRRYFKYRIEEKISQKEALYKGLEEQGQTLEGRALFLHRQSLLQGEKIEELKRKIDEWQMAVQEGDNRVVQDQIQCAQKAAKRIQIKNSNLALDYYKHAVLPEALKQAQYELEKEYAQNARNEAYIAQRLAKLRDFHD